MDSHSTKYLPGGFDQFINFDKFLDFNEKKILFIGSGLEKLLLKADLSLFSSVYFIVDDHESLMNSRLILAEKNDLNVRIMEFDNTDFKSDEFDLVYSQGSHQNEKKNKNVKEIKRILKPNGIFCVGESVKLENELPKFILDLYSVYGTEPLYINKLKEYYVERNFEVLSETELSYTLKKYYKSWNDLLDENLKKLTDKEKQQNKKLIKLIGHESNAYLNLGGSRFMGFKMLILKKGL
ncbi:MAG: hypothetical protein CO128_07485 [Ignavibacteriales bacterium CG_4_9_14_3_um_filter_30_11]|nr:MAG: hypothetical protein CO128_07485 [Ignavibacteriales bacterium CG_4_9_14_3_um_filter_30_11]